MRRKSADPGSVAALFVAHEERLGRFLAQFVRSRALAEDLLQETFVVAVRAGDELERIENKEAWLFAVARNRALESLRKGRRGLRAFERLKGERGVGGDPADAVPVRDLLERHFTADERILLLLRYVHDFNSDDLSTIVGASPEAVRQRLSRLRRRLADLLREPAGDDPFPAAGGAGPVKPFSADAPSLEQGIVR